jgi:hypothetical protein
MVAWWQRAQVHRVFFRGGGDDDGSDDEPRMFLPLL